MTNPAHSMLGPPQNPFLVIFEHFFFAEKNLKGIAGLFEILVEKRSGGAELDLKLREWEIYSPKGKKPTKFATTVHSSLEF